MRGLATNGLVEILATQDRKRVKFVFEQAPDQQFWVDMPSASLHGMLPLISKAVAATQSDDTCTTIEVVNAAVSLDPENELILEFENTAGAKMGFHLPKGQLLRFSALLDSPLQHQSGSKSAH